MNSAQASGVVRAYLRRLEAAAAAALPPTQREELVTGIREHLDEALRDIDASDETAIRNALERLGPPDEIVAAATGTDASAMAGAAQGQESAGAATPLVWGIVGLTVLPVIGSVIAIVTGTRARRRAAAAARPAPTAAVAGQALGWLGVAVPILALLFLYFTLATFLTFAAFEDASATTVLAVGVVAHALPVAGCVAMVVSARSRQRRAALTGQADPLVRGALGWIGIAVLALGAAVFLVPFITGTAFGRAGLALSTPAGLAGAVAAIMGAVAVPAAAAVIVGRRSRRNATHHETAEPLPASAAEVVGWYLLTLVAASLLVAILLALAGWADA